MSCTAMENETWASSSRNTFCGTLNIGPKLGAGCTSGKSSDGMVCTVNLLLPPLRISRFWLDSSDTTWSAGMVRKMSISLRAPTVIVKSPVSPPSWAWVRIWISRSLVVNSSVSPVLRSSTLARMGKVLRRSTMPAIDCSTASTSSCLAFNTIIVFSGIFPIAAQPRLFAHFRLKISPSAFALTRAVAGSLP